MKDLHDNIKVVRSFAAVRLLGTTDVTGLDVDRQGFESVEHIVTVGVTGDTLSGSVKFDLILEHADADSTGAAAGTYSAVTSSNDVLGGSVDSSGIFATVDSSADDDVVYQIGYVGGKRFTRVRVDLTGTHTNGTPAAGIAVLGNASLLPTT